MCARTAKGTTRKDLVLRELSKEDLEHIFETSFVNQLRQVQLNGNFGEPVASSQTLWFCEYLKKRKVPAIEVFTSGSLRTPDWWRELGGLLNQNNDLVRFSIYGLEDTNGIYRVNSNFEKIIDNAKTFIKAGGVAQWEFIVFDHNQHQIEKARDLARSLGFSGFAVKRSRRNKDNLKYKLTQTVNSNTRFADEEKYHRKYKNWSEYLKITPITCKYVDLSKIFIDFFGDLWPCTWFGFTPLAEPSSAFRSQTESLYQKYGRGFNSVLKNSLPEVLEHPWFNEELEDSWKAPGHRQCKRFDICSQLCGDAYEHTSGPGKNYKVERFNVPSSKK